MFIELAEQTIGTDHVGHSCTITPSTNHIHEEIILSFSENRIASTQWNHFQLHFSKANGVFSLSSSFDIPMTWRLNTKISHVDFQRSRNNFHLRRTRCDGPSKRNIRSMTNRFVKVKITDRTCAFIWGELLLLFPTPHVDISIMNRTDRYQTIDIRRKTLEDSPTIQSTRQGDSRWTLPQRQWQIYDHPIRWEPFDRRLNPKRGLWGRGQSRKRKPYVRMGEKSWTRSASYFACCQVSTVGGKG